MKNQLRKMCLLIDQELSILYENCLNDVALTMAYGLAFEVKDSLKDDDELYQHIFSIQHVLSPFLLSAKPYSNDLNFAMENAFVFYPALEEEINRVASYKNDSYLFSSSLFNPYTEDLDYQKAELYRRLLRTLRLRFILKDIQDGIEEYGLEPYKVESSDQINPLRLPFIDSDTMDIDSVKEEVMHLLSYGIQDTEDDIDNLKNLSALCVSFDKIKGEN